jgi:amidohydrolase
VTEVARLYAEAEALRERLVAVRRDLHAHPELAFCEMRTAGIVASRLGELGFEVQTGVGKTGVVGILEGGKGAKGAQDCAAQDSANVLLLRFDMDALPIREANDLPYRSLNEGVMHACGHDAHTSIGLGVAELLARHREDWAGIAKFVFQPAEETVEGALAMIKDGALTAPAPGRVLSMHVDSKLPCGKLGVTEGPIMASTDDFRIVLRGRGTHGSTPHQGADPIVAAAQVISALQTIVSRNISPMDTAVVSVGYIRGGTAQNIIPDLVEFGGTLRSYKEGVTTALRERVRAIVTSVAAGLDVEATLAFSDHVTPSVVNDPVTTALVRAVATGLVGAQNVLSDYRLAWAEDAAYFLQRMPGTYVFVGAGNGEKGITEPHHSPRFQIDEDALPIAVALLTASAMAFL